MVTIVLSVWKGKRGGGRGFRSLRRPPGYLGSCSHSPLWDENIGRKFEPSTQFPHLFYGEIPLPGQKHRDRTLRTKLRNQVTLLEILPFNEKPNNGSRISPGNRVMLLLITFHQQG